MFYFVILFCAAIQVLYGNPIPQGLQYASQRESPWLALIKIGNYRCGGSLVQNKFIITAAHCFDDINIRDPHDLKTVKVILGDWKTETEKDCNENVSGESCDHAAEIKVKEIRMHKDYKVSQSKTKYKNDIAIIMLGWKPRKSVLIQNVKLPKSNRCAMDVVDEKWNFTGFGLIPGGKYTTIKKKIDLDVISKDVCKQHLGESEKLFLMDTHVCGRNAVTQTCKGDSGSGVTRTVNGITYLEGIVSFGADQCEVGSTIPTGLLKVSCFKSWVRQQLDDLDSDSDASESSSDESGDVKPDQDKETSPTQDNDEKDNNNDKEDDENEEVTTAGYYIEDSDNGNDVF